MRTLSYYSFHVAAFVANDSSGHLEFRLVVDLNVKPTSVLDVTLLDRLFLVFLDFSMIALTVYTVGLILYLLLFLQNVGCLILGLRDQKQKQIGIILMEEKLMIGNQGLHSR